MPKGYGYGGESASSKSGKVGMPGGHAIHKHMSNSAFMKKETIKQEKTNLLENDPIPTRASSLEMVSPLEFHKGVPHPPKRSMLSEAKELPKSKAKEAPKQQLNEMLPTRNNMLSNVAKGVDEAKEFSKKQLNDMLSNFAKGVDEAEEFSKKQMLPIRNNMSKAR
jgi:hypothetical protein